MSDNDTIMAAQRQMNAAALALAKMANDLADAKTVREYSSDRLKRAFSVTVAEFLEAGESGVAAEHKGRASKAYGAHLHDLSEQYRSAMRIIEEAEANRIKYESARSILSCEKEKLRL